MSDNENHPAPPPASEHVPEAAFGNTERAGLIAVIKYELAEFAHNKVLETLLLDAVEMLETDAQEIARVKEMAHSEKRFADMHYAEKMAIKAQQVAVPAGWALVPIEPTPEMCAEGLEDEGVTIKDGKRYAYALWSAMISAAKGAKP